MDIVCLGEPLVEFNRQSDGRWLEGFGGDTSNVAIAAARQGASTGIITAIGEDEFGDSLMELWSREGVSARFVSRDAHAPTGLYFVRHGAQGHVFSYRRAGSAASLMRPQDLPEEAIGGARILHLSGITQAISSAAADTGFAAMALARERGVTVSYDTNLRRRLWPLDRARAIIHEAVRHTHILLPGLEDAHALTGLTDPHAILEHYAAMGPKVVALTLGEAGAAVWTDGETLDVPAFPTTLVDASGAGDCFDGAFLARWLRDGDVAAAARYANVAAALSVRDYGAIAPIPKAGEVEAALEACP